jgi:hypothetical protein
MIGSREGCFTTVQTQEGLVNLDSLVSDRGGFKMNSISLYRVFKNYWAFFSMRIF